MCVLTKSSNCLLPSTIQLLCPASTSPTLVQIAATAWGKIFNKKCDRTVETGEGTTAASTGERQLLCFMTKTCDKCDKCYRSNRGQVTGD